MNIPDVMRLLWERSLATMAPMVTYWALIVLFPKDWSGIQLAQINHNVSQ